jgi:hypothetical protein
MTRFSSQWKARTDSQNIRQGSVVNGKLEQIAKTYDKVQ